MCGNLVSIRNQLVDIDASKWEQQFVALCEAKKHELEPKWREDWKSLANGKLILNQVFRDLGAKLSCADFKRRIVAEMAAKKTQDWQEVDTILESTLPK